MITTPSIDDMLTNKNFNVYIKKVSLSNDGHATN